MIDAYLYGMVSPSTVYLLRSDFPFPKPNQYAEIEKALPSVGGEAANSAIVLSKFGLTTKLDGNWQDCRFAESVFSTLRGFGIDVGRLTVTERGGANELVITDQSSRTVFGNYASLHEGPPQWNEPNEEDIRAASVVCIDPFFLEQSERAGELCVKHGKPYVTLDCAPDEPLAQRAAAVVVSTELLAQKFAGCPPRQVFAEYQAKCSGLIVFTFGGETLLWGRRGQSIMTFAPYDIEPVDTAGAGDAFRGALAYGIHQGWDDLACVDLASATAACVCLTVPHALNAPDLRGVQAFMRERAADRASAVATGHHD